MAALDYREYYTRADYIQWKGDWELIDGIAYAMAPSPVVTHQRVSLKIAMQLENNMTQCQKCLALTETDYEISEDTILRPDVMFVCGDIEEKVNHTPQIIFEVLSPATTRRDETVKFEIYRREGVQYYIIVNSLNKQAKVYRLTASGQYVKAGDFSSESYRFETEVCAVDFDFSTIWRR